jgi:hypothetical protein
MSLNFLNPVNRNRQDQMVVILEEKMTVKLGGSTEDPIAATLEGRNLMCMIQLPTKRRTIQKLLRHVEGFLLSTWRATTVSSESTGKAIQPT